MDPRLLRYYNQELRYLREMGAEFAKEFPKIASRLAMDTLEVSDPYIERLLEGCAFLAARVQLKQDAEFPKLSHRLLEILYPNLLAPVPSMVVAQVEPVRADPNLVKGSIVERGTSLLAAPTAQTRTRCEFRTAQALQLTPLTTEFAEYFLNLADLRLPGLGLNAKPRSGVRVRLTVPEGMLISQLGLDRLRFYFGGQAETAFKLSELMITSLVGVLVNAPGSGENRRLLDAGAFVPLGLDDGDAMLPVQLRMMSGLRLLQEYLAFPQRFLFFDLRDLFPAWASVTGRTVEITFLFSRQAELEGVVDASNFSLHCVPAINLFEKRTDRIAIDAAHHEFQVVPDLAAPLDFEVYDVLSVMGFGDQGHERRFRPLFAPEHLQKSGMGGFYTVWREPRLLPERARRAASRSNYLGSEVYVSLVDPDDAPVAHGLRQLSLVTRCTNRDLPLFVLSGSSVSPLTLNAGVQVESVRAIAGPSRPYSAVREGGIAWRLINLLSLNYLSLLDTDAGEGAAALRDLLSRLPRGDQPEQQQRLIESIHAVEAKPIVRRHPSPGPIAFSRGLHVDLTLDELGHQGGSSVLFASILHEFLTRHASMNSFVETALHTPGGGEVMRWRPRRGVRPIG